MASGWLLPRRWDLWLVLLSPDDQFRYVWTWFLKGTPMILCSGGHDCRVFAHTSGVNVANYRGASPCQSDRGHWICIVRPSTSARSNSRCHWSFIYRWPEKQTRATRDQPRRDYLSALTNIRARIRCWVSPSKPHPTSSRRYQRFICGHYLKAVQRLAG